MFSRITLNHHQIWFRLMFLKISTVKLQIVNVKCSKILSHPKLTMKRPTSNYSVPQVTYPVIISVVVTSILTPLSTVTVPMVTIILYTGITLLTLPHQTTNHISIKILIFYKEKHHVSVVALLATKRTFSMTKYEPYMKPHHTMSSSVIKEETFSPNDEQSEICIDKIQWSTNIPNILFFYVKFGPF